MLEEEKEAENLVEKLFQDKLTELRRAKRTRKLEKLKEKEDKKKRVNTHDWNNDKPYECGLETLDGG